MKNTRSCRAELPVEVWLRLAALAEQDGVSLGTYARRVLTDHVTGGEVSEVPDTGPTVDQWQTLVRWVQANPEKWATYTGPRGNQTPADRAAVYRWFLETSGIRSVGYQPSNREK